jgi:transglutaminase-like putative cysteine protease
MNTAQSWSIRFTRLTDLIALGTLLVLPEVEMAVRGSILLLAGIAWLLRKRSPLPDRWTLIFLFFAIASAATLALRGFMHPIVAAAQVAPLTHGLTWFTAQSVRNRGWRLGLGFVDLLLASALTVELFLPVAIFLFAIVASVALSLNFLAGELGRRNPRAAEESLPRGYTIRSFLLALLLFLSSGVIYPLLPRQNWQGSAAWSGPSQVGYTEEVRPSGPSLQSEPGGGPVQLRIFLSGADYAADLLQPGYFGYLRVTPLESFDGKRWFRKSSLPQKVIDPSGRHPEDLEVEILREPLDSDFLPVPLGAVEVQKPERPEREQPQRESANEWRDRRSRYSRTRYFVRFNPSVLPKDPPEAELSYVPPNFRGSRIETLAKNLWATSAGQNPSLKQKLATLQEFYRSQGFQAEYTRADNKVLEDFLFSTKAGHCEWFASSSAVLLRMSGTPARVVAGFRISRAPSAGSLVVRSGDAHAWVEAWDPKRGWVSYDPTPRVLYMPPWYEPARTAVDWLSNAWYRYVVAYSENSESSFRLGDLTLSRAAEWKWLTPRLTTEVDWGGWLARTLSVITGSTLIAGLLFWRRKFLIEWGDWFMSWFLSKLKYTPSRVVPVPASLLRERQKMEHLLQGPLPNQEWKGNLSGALVEWLKIYWSARFGSGDKNVTRRLRHLRSEYARLLKATKEASQ